MLPLRGAAGPDWPRTAADRDLVGYLRRLATVLDVTVVDGSDPDAYRAHARAWGDGVRQLRPMPWPGANGKVAAVVTGVRAARHERVVIADDDVRYTLPQLRAVLRPLRGADLVRPQNVFTEQVWHARWDTARSLLNRAFGADHPGTFALRRSSFLAMGGYRGDVLFENLELARSVQASGGTEARLPGLFVGRRAPTIRHFLDQRIRQAYDDLGQPGRLAAEAALLPLALTGALLERRNRGSCRYTRLGLLGLALAGIGAAEVGRRSDRGGEAFGPTAALWAPAWLAERSLCVWLALGTRLRGGIRYSCGRIRVAAHSVCWLRRYQQSALPLPGLPIEGLPIEGLPNDGQPNDGQPNDGQPNDGLPMERRARFIPAGLGSAAGRKGDP